MTIRRIGHLAIVFALLVGGLLADTATSSAQTNGTTLIDALPATLTGEHVSIEVMTLTPFSPDGGRAILEPGTSEEEEFWYRGIDTTESTLVGLDRPWAVDHESGAFLEPEVVEEPTAQAAEGDGPDGASVTATNAGAAGDVASIDVPEVETLVATGEAATEVAVPTTQAGTLDVLCTVSSALCGLAVDPTTMPVEELAGPSVNYELRLPEASTILPDTALPGENNLFSASAGVPVDVDAPLDTTASGSRACSYTNTTYREGRVGEGDDGFSGADDQLGAHTATRASSGPFGVNASYREANAWTRAGIALGVRLKGASSIGVTVTYPWNTLGEMDVQEGGGRQASGTATFRIKALDYTGCPDTPTTLSGCSTTIGTTQVKEYSKSTSGITPYNNSGSNALQLTLYNRHRYVFFIEVSTMSTAQGAFTSPSTGYSIVDFFGGSNRGWLNYVKVRLNSGRFSKC